MGVFSFGGFCVFVADGTVVTVVAEGDGEAEAVGVSVIVGEGLGEAVGEGVAVGSKTTKGGKTIS